MSKWNGNIISKDARYRTQSASQARGIYSLDEQLQHRNADNWTQPVNIGINTGYHFEDLTLIDGPSSGTGDGTNFSVVTVPMPEGASQGRLYLACEITSSPSYKNDFTIGSIQIPHNNGNGLNTTEITSTNVNWNFHDQATTATWDRASNSNVAAGNDTISSISGYTWSAIGSSSQKRWGRASSTSSSGTGATDGIDVDDNIFTLLGDLSTEGNSANRIAQGSAKYYLYVESSGTSTGNIIWCRSPEVNLINSNHVVVIAYHAASDNLVMVNTTDKPLLRVYWVES